MFRSIFDHPQGDIYIYFFTSVTKDKLIGFVSMPVILVVFCVDVAACPP